MSDQQAVIERVLRGTRTWAVVGCSPDPRRDSHRIAALLQRHGYRVIPVNPGCDEVLGERAYATLADVEEPVDVVDVFRRSAAASAHVAEAVAIGARAVWLQLGVFAAAGSVARAQAAGLDVVEQRCPAIELPRLSPR
jgi:predicted CoA-binding protein